MLVSIPLNGAAPGSGVWVILYLLIGIVAGFGAATISYIVATITGYGIVSLGSVRSDTSKRAVFNSHAVAGSLLGGVYAISFVGLLVALEWWYVDVLGTAANFNFYVPAIIATAIAAAVWTFASLGYSQRRESDLRHEPKSRSVSALLIDIGVFLVSLLVLLPIGFLLLLAALFY